MLNNQIIETIIFLIYSTFYALSIIAYKLKSFKNIIKSYMIQEKDVIISVNQGQKKINENLCIFSYYQPNALKKTTKEYLRHLNEDCNYSICLISTSKINKEDLETLKEYCFEIIIKSNNGYDFGSYKLGILKYKEQRNNLQNILLANDSVLGPLFSMKDNFNKMNNENSCDFWGIADNCYLGIHSHIISFFVNFKKNLVNSDLLYKFFEDYHPISNRDSTIHKGEIALSKYLTGNHFYYDSLFSMNFIFQRLQENTKLLTENQNIMSDHPVLRTFAIKTEVTKQTGIFHNRSLFYYLHFILVKEFKMPFIKRDALGKAGTPGIYNTFKENQLACLLDQIKIETNIKKKDVLNEFRAR